MSPLMQQLLLQQLQPRHSGARSCCWGSCRPASPPLNEQPVLLALLMPPLLQVRVPLPLQLPLLQVRVPLPLQLPLLLLLEGVLLPPQAPLASQLLALLQPALLHAWGAPPLQLRLTPRVALLLLLLLLPAGALLLLLQPQPLLLGALWLLLLGLALPKGWPV